MAAKSKKAEVKIEVKGAQAKSVLVSTAKIKPLNPNISERKYTGDEPTWHKQPDAEARSTALTKAFNWYNYHYDKKTAKDLVVDWLLRCDRNADAKLFARVPDTEVRVQTGWLCRMNVMGLQFNEHESLIVETAIANHLKQHKSSKEAAKEVAPEERKPNIQDRLREKMSEAAAELEGMFDEFVKNGAKLTADIKPIVVIRSMNVAPQLIGEIAQIWQHRLDELTEAATGKDPQLVEGYSHFGKIQMRNLIKFAELVISDCGSYVQIKKTERKPRAKKPVSSEKLTAKFKYLKEFPELKLKSVAVTQLVGASEAWLYDTRKRKLIHVMADSHVGSFSVKGSALIGFDTTNSTQKTLRKPADQLKAIMAAGAPQARKLFKDIKSTEVKFNGRGNENIILLKVR